MIAGKNSGFLRQVLTSVVSTESTLAIIIMSVSLRILMKLDIEASPDGSSFSP